MSAFKKQFMGIAALSALALSGCGGGEPDCSYDLDNFSEINSIRVFYPCDLDTNSKSYHATTLSGGLSNNKEQMYWLADTLVSDGDMIVFALSATSNWTVAGYTDAHMEAFETILDENDDRSSPLYNRIDKIALMGYSMGGGAVLNAGDALGNDVDAIVSLAPYNPLNTLDGIDASTLLLVGENDTVAFPFMAERAYDDVSNSLDKVLMELDDFQHLRWVSNNDNDENTNAAKDMIVAFLDFALNGSSSARSDLINAPSVVVINENNL